MNKNEQQYLVEKIRTQYTERTHTELDALRALDKKVKSPVQIFAYTFGSVGALILGAGMSLIMTDLAQTLGLGSAMLPAVMIGLVGMLMAIFNYPLYRRMLRSRRRKYAHEIIALSDRIIEG